MKECSAALMTNFEVFWICSLSCLRLTLLLMPDFNLGGAEEQKPL